MVDDNGISSNLAHAPTQLWGKHVWDAMVAPPYITSHDSPHGEWITGLNKDEQAAIR